MIDCSRALWLICYESIGEGATFSAAPDVTAAQTGRFLAEYYFFHGRWPVIHGYHYFVNDKYLFAGAYNVMPRSRVAHQNDAHVYRRHRNELYDWRAA